MKNRGLDRRVFFNGGNYLFAIDEVVSNQIHLLDKKE